MPELFRRIPQTQETKRPKNENSDRNIKQRLFSLREELNRIEDDISYQQLNKLQANLGSLLKKRDALQKEIAEIEFSLMSEAKKNEYFTELEEALEKFDDLQKKKSTDKDYYQAKKEIIALQKEIKEKTQQIPAGAWKDFVARKEKSEENNNERRLQEKAKEAITAGILQLNRTLEEINRTKGSLPGTIIYPETTTRPLSYAVEPLLKEIYSKHQQELPQRVFVKTFSEHQMDKNRKLDQERDEKLKQLKNEQRKNQEIIEKTKRELKKYRPRSKEYVTASEQLHQLQEKKKNLRGSIVKTKENIRIFEQGADLQAMNQRVNEITSNASDNPILVIDDLVGRGRTFRALNDALKDAGHDDDTYFFSFLATPYSLQDLPIPNDQFSTGTIIQDTTDLEDLLQEDGEERQEFIPNFAHDRIVEADRTWSSLLSSGFPFRLKKEEATGVLKDQMDPNPYVVRSDKGNPFLMHRLRQEYRAWGEEALKNSEPIDIQTPTKEATDNPATPSLETAAPYAFSRLTNKEWRQEVLERVDQLIEQITDNGIEELIFLDKSARPLSWLVKERWKHKNIQKQSPKIKYIDLGLTEMKDNRLGEQTIVEQMQKEADDLYKNKDESQKYEYTNDDDWFWKKDSFAEGNDVDGEIWMSKNHISPLWRDVIKRHPELIAKIRARYGTKLGKTLIIDELLFSGGTLNTAVALFTEAYPETEVHGVHFFIQNCRNPATQIPWFKKKHMIGVEEDEDSLTTKRFSKQGSQNPDLSKELRKIIKDIATSDLDN